MQKSYDGESLIVKDLNLDIRKGEFLTLLGPSGSGKTTSLMMLAGFETPTAGEIQLAGRSINNVPPHKRDIGMVFQNYALFPHMTVAENLAFPLSVRNLSKTDISERVKRVLNMVQLDAFAKRYPGQLSGGQQQRVALARALVFEPQLVLMDEPLGALDKQLREHMQMEIKHLHQRLGVTVVYVTHDQIEAMTLGDKVAVMKDGLIQQFGTPQQIYNDPANLFVASFIGSPPMNFIPLRLQRKDGRLQALLDSGQARCELPLGLNDAGLEEREVILGIRPEQIALAPAQANGLPSIRAEVQITEPTGPDLLVFVTLNQTKVCCRLAPDVAVQVGDTLNLQFDPARVLLFDAASGERLGVNVAQRSAQDKVAQFKGR
ncbi:MAG: ABC transporter ATP-binding protein [Pseudomonas sp.]